MTAKFTREDLRGALNKLPWKYIIILVQDQEDKGFLSSSLFTHGDNHHLMRGSAWDAYVSDRSVKFHKDRVDTIVISTKDLIAMYDPETKEFNFNA